MKKLSDFLRELPPRAMAVVTEVFPDVAQEAHRSVVEGSDLTGAPGQPVDTGNLKASWQLEFPSPTLARISTNVAYAESIEDGVSYAHGGAPMTLRSPVGGFHSVRITILGLQRIAEAVAARRRRDG